MSKDTQKVTLAHGATLDGKYHAPGSTVTLRNDEAASLRASGYVLLDDPAEAEVGPDAAAGR